MENNKLRERILVSVSPVTPVYPTMQQRKSYFQQGSPDECIIEVERILLYTGFSP